MMINAACILTILVLFHRSGESANSNKNIRNEVQNINNKDSCSNGRYRVRSPPFSPGCSSFRDCEPGFYCVDGEKFPCPPGVYGDSPRLNSSSCSGICPPGHFCPEQTVSNTAHKCGDIEKYCPERSGEPLIAPPGFYTVNTDGLDTRDRTHYHSQRRSAILICPFGNTCTGGQRSSCPGGTYGDSKGLHDVNCSGVCPAGWFCPIASTLPRAHPCGPAHVFCPEGSVRPIRTAEGYYTIGQQLADGGGFTDEVVCPLGSYCIKGIRYLSPAGRYISTKRMFNASGTGECTKGYYCPIGSVGRTQHICNDTAYFCPEASPVPVKVSRGYYSINAKDVEYEVIYDATFTTSQPNTNAVVGMSLIAQRECLPGTYCLDDGIKRPCPAGTYGAESQLKTAYCSGICLLGYYCPDGSIKPDQIECGSSDLFCPPGSADPQLVHEGYYTVLGETDSTRGAQRKCEPGMYCLNGTKRECLPGFWGGSYGMSDPYCSGKCEKGHYCPLGSLKPTEVMCGEPSKYCPGNDFKPIDVDLGYYTIGGTESTRSGQKIAPLGHYAFGGLLYKCPAGTYGATEGQSTPTCTDHCTVNGYYCHQGSISPTQRKCGGDHHICPAGVQAPIKVHMGFYTADYDYEDCKPGMWRNTTYPKEYFYDEGKANWTIRITHMQADCELCPDGTYKAVVGDHHSQCITCPYQSESFADRSVCDCTAIHPPGYTSYFDINAGTCTKMLKSEGVLLHEGVWLTENSMTRYKETPCTLGHFCIDGVQQRCPAGRWGSMEREIRPECQGACKEGYYCMEASQSPYSYPCGQADFVCPEGSSMPHRVPKGFYSNEEVPEELRSYYLVCSKGYYCPGDGKRRKCPAGRYASSEGHETEECEGPCTSGHYCIEGSSSKVQYTCGNATVFCKTGSIWPTLITPGFYGIHTGVAASALVLTDLGNASFSAEIVCQQGYYCTGGIKYPCGPGRYGWRFGISDWKCSGLCAPGFYCPSYMLREPAAPAYAEFPEEVHLNAVDYKCGNNEYYCPSGSFYPIQVESGYYSVGGSYHNHTRYSQEICEPGTYCDKAIAIQCPRGRYGDSYGLTVPTCTERCPVANYCPPGSSAPIPCPNSDGLFTYSTGGAYKCTACDGRLTPLPCQYEKSCCYRDSIDDEDL